MARHRNVRTMNYEDEYYDEDDVYGHSVEDNYCISPATAAQFTFNRDHHVNLSNYMEEGIPEEEEGSEGEHDPLSDSGSGRRHLNLTEMEEGQLNSCLEEVRNVLGETVPEQVMIQTIINHKYSIEKSLNELLSLQDAPKPQRQPRQNRRNRSQDDDDNDDFDEFLSSLQTDSPSNPSVFSSDVKLLEEKTKSHLPQHRSHNSSSSNKSSQCENKHFSLENSSLDRVDKSSCKNENSLKHKIHEKKISELSENTKMMKLDDTQIRNNSHFQQHSTNKTKSSEILISEKSPQEEVSVVNKDAQKRKQSNSLSLNDLAQQHRSQVLGHSSVKVAKQCEEIHVELVNDVQDSKEKEKDQDCMTTKQNVKQQTTSLSDLAKNHGTQTSLTSCKFPSHNQIGTEATSLSNMAKQHKIQETSLIDRTKQDNTLAAPSLSDMAKQHRTPAAPSLSDMAKQHKTPAAPSLSDMAKQHKTPAAPSLSDMAKQHKTPAAPSLSDMAKQHKTPATPLLSDMAKQHKTPAAPSLSDMAKQHNTPATQSLSDMAKQHKIPAAQSLSDMAKQHKTPAMQSLSDMAKQHKTPAAPSLSDMAKQHRTPATPLSDMAKQHKTPAVPSLGDMAKQHKTQAAPSLSDMAKQHKTPATPLIDMAKQHKTPAAPSLSDMAKQLETPATQSLSDMARQHNTQTISQSDIVNQHKAQTTSLGDLAKQHKALTTSLRDKTKHNNTPPSSLSDMAKQNKTQTESLSDVKQHSGKVFSLSDLAKEHENQNTSMLNDRKVTSLSDLAKHKERQTVSGSVNELEEQKKLVTSLSDLARLHEKKTLRDLAKQHTREGQMSSLKGLAKQCEKNFLYESSKSPKKEDSNNSPLGKQSQYQDVEMSLGKDEVEDDIEKQLRQHLHIEDVGSEDGRVKLDLLCRPSGVAMTITGHFRPIMVDQNVNKIVKYPKFSYKYQTRNLKIKQKNEHAAIVPFDFSTPSPDDIVKQKQSKAFSRTGERKISK